MKIEISETSEHIEVKLLEQKKFGRTFFKSERYFIASNGIILGSDEPRFAAHPRVSRLCFPTCKEEFARQSIHLEKSNVNKFFVDCIIVAIKEYNEAIR